jgi:hypothetical protein
VTDDFTRIKILDEKVGTTRFEDVDGRYWWIYEFRVVERDGRRRRELVRGLATRDVEYRMFVNSIGVRRVYRFADRRERREYKCKHLDRQILEARSWRPRALLPRQHESAEAAERYERDLR